MRRLLLALLLLTPALAGALPLRVAVSVLPQKYFVERVAGERARVTVLVGPGQSPATFDPGPRSIAEVAGCDLLLPLGLPFERNWLPRLVAVNPDLRVVDMSTGLMRLALPGHRHGAREHAGEPDPHLWTDPRRVERMLPRLTKALAAIDPEGANAYRANAAAFAADLERLDDELAALLAPLRGRRFLVFHPSWGYFAERYALVQVAIELEGKEPGAKALVELIERARAERVQAVFVQEQFAAGTARAVAEAIGARLVRVDPLAEDYLANLRKVGQAFAAALGADAQR